MLGTNVISFAAIRGVQARRAYYVAVVPLKVVVTFFHFDPAGLPPEARAQRELNRSRIPAIARYIVDNPDEYVLSALCASIDGELEFEPAGPGPLRSVGRLNIDVNATILINDGQHRRAAIAAAIRDRPSLADETIAIVIYADRGLERAQQMFVDLNQNSVKPALSLRLLYDRRNEATRLTCRVLEAVPVLSELTEYERSAPAPGSRKLFGFSSVHKATLMLKTAVEDVSECEATERIAAFWSAVVFSMPDWQAAANGTADSAELRRHFVHAHGLALEAIAVACLPWIPSVNGDWNARLQPLRSIDWGRANSSLWEGRALVGGRINRSRSSILRTSEVVAGALGINEGSASRTDDKGI